MRFKELGEVEPQSLFKTVISGKFIKDFFAGTSRAAYFWNGLIYLTFIVLAFIDIEYCGFICFFASIFSFTCFFDDEFDKNPNCHYWPPLGIPFWFMILFGIMIGIIFLINDKLIKPFNNWLNKTKSN